MCGIFGCVQNKTGIDPKLISELVEANLSRGDRSWGLFCWTPSRSMILRSTEKWDPSILASDGSLDLGIDISWAQVVLGHVRAPTSGENRLLDTHPFETERFLLAMNGIFTKVVSTAVESGVDSAHLASFIETYPLDSSEDDPTPSVRISVAMSNFEGQAACWLWDKREEQLYLWRATNPIYQTWDFLEGGFERFTFSSTSNNRGWSLLREGRIYRIDPRTGECPEMNSFDTSSIYKFVDEVPPSSDTGR